MKRREIVEMNDNDDDDDLRVDSIYQRAKIFEEKKKKRKTQIHILFILSLEYRFEKYFRIESNWEKRVFSRIFEEGMEVSSFTKRKRRTIESFLLHAFQDFQKKRGRKWKKNGRTRRRHGEGGKEPKGSICRSDFTGIENEREPRQQLFLSIRFFWPGLLR